MVIQKSGEGGDGTRETLEPRVTKRNGTGRDSPAFFVPVPGFLTRNVGICCQARFLQRDYPTDFCPGPDCLVASRPGPDFVTGKPPISGHKRVTVIKRQHFLKSSCFSRSEWHFLLYLRKHSSMISNPNSCEIFSSGQTSSGSVSQET